MTLKDIIESHVTSVFLNENHFSEAVRYESYDGHVATIQAIVTDEFDNVIEAGVISRLNRVVLRFNEDDATPRVGDKVTINQKTFVFTGESTPENGITQAMFERHTVDQFGGQRRYSD